MSYLYCLFSDFECQLWPSKAISVKVIQGKVPLFFIGLAMFKMAFFCQTSRFRDPLASGPLWQKSSVANVLKRQMKKGKRHKNLKKAFVSTTAFGTSGKKDGGKLDTANGQLY